MNDKNPKSSAQQVKIELIDTLLDDYNPEIADILNARGIRPGGSARRGESDARFTALRVAYTRFAGRATALGWRDDQIIVIGSLLRSPGSTGSERRAKSGSCRTPPPTAMKGSPCPF